MPEDTFRWVIAGGVAVAVLCIVTMAVVSVLLYRIASRLQVRMDAVAQDVEPAVKTMRQFVNENAPKVSVIATRAVEIAANAKDISDIANDQAHRFAEVGRDIADRAKAQVARVDAAVDDTLEQLHQAGEQLHNVGDNVKSAVLKPVREAEAVFSGFKAAISSLANGRRSTVDHVTQDEEMFI
jgi:methyl-accepting chemotaxis protein